MKIAIIYICTGKYDIFWEQFYKSGEEYFYPEQQKHYFVFTDSDELIQKAEGLENVSAYFQRKAGWPYDTLMRFNTFCTIQDKLLGFDYCYFWNANTCFLRKIDEDVIPFPTKENQLVLWRHTLCYDDEYGKTFEPERNQISEAYIKEGDKCHPYGGGFFGGTSEGFIKMSQILRDRVARDLQKGIIAIWHDQSHLIKYGMQIDCVEVPKDTIVSEEYMQDRNPAAIFLNKEAFGGNGKLRELSLTQRIKTKTIKIMVKIGQKTHLTKLVKKILKKDKK